MSSDTPRMIITVDTEALPARASEDHVERLIWGNFANGSAGIKDICDIVEDAGGKAVFFLDVAGSFNQLAEYREVNSFLERRGHAVEWHYHPEILGKAFWKQHGVTATSTRQDLYNKHDADIVLSKGLAQFELITGRKPNAYRAGSFRWNAQTIDFLSRNGIPYSYNACAETAEKSNYDTYSPGSAKPFRWENGVIEVPCGELRLENEIVHFRFPRQLPKGFSFNNLADGLAAESGGLVNILLHSWSLLSKNEETQHFYYESQERLDYLARILRDLSKQYQFQNDVFI